MKRRSAIAHWKARLLKAKGLPHNKKAIENREKHVETNLIEEEGEVVMKLKESKEKFKDLDEKGQECRDKELMEMHPNESDEDSAANRKKEKEVLRKIQKEQTRNHDFHYITKHVVKGVNGSLKILQEKDDNVKIIKTHTKRKDNEEEIIKHNTKHCSMAIETKMYQDKIYAKLDDKATKTFLSFCNC